MIREGEKIHCPFCSRVAYVAAADMVDDTIMSPDLLTYADGRPVKDADIIGCEHCGKHYAGINVDSGLLTGEQQSRGPLRANLGLMFCPFCGESFDTSKARSRFVLVNNVWYHAECLAKEYDTAINRARNAETLCRLLREWSANVNQYLNVQASGTAAELVRACPFGDESNKGG